MSELGNTPSQAYDDASAPEDAAAPEDSAAAALPEAEFSAWLRDRLRDVPGRDVYADVFDDACAAILRWRRRFAPALWRRLMKERLLKELVEIAPVIAAVRDLGSTMVRALT